jgi:hypothetical protein
MDTSTTVGLVIFLLVAILLSIITRPRGSRH